MRKKNLKRLLDFNIYNACLLNMPQKQLTACILSISFSVLSGIAFVVPLLFSYSLPVLKRNNAEAFEIFTTVATVTFIAVAISIIVNFFQYLLVRSTVKDLQEKHAVACNIMYLWTFSQLLFLCIYVVLWSLESVVNVNVHCWILNVVLVFCGVHRLLLMFFYLRDYLKNSLLPGIEVVFCIDVWYVFFLMLN